jgi:hypothetical protein
MKKKFYLFAASLLAFGLHANAQTFTVVDEMAYYSSGDLTLNGNWVDRDGDEAGATALTMTGGSLTLIYDYNSQGLPSSVIMTGGTMTMGSGSGISSTWALSSLASTWALNVPEGGIANLVLGEKAIFGGVVTGSGTINLTVGDSTLIGGTWKDFTGTLNIIKASDKSCVMYYGNAWGSGSAGPLNSMGKLPTEALSYLMKIPDNTIITSFGNTGLALSAVSGSPIIHAKSNIVFRPGVSSTFTGVIDSIGKATNIDTYAGTGAFTFAGASTMTCTGYIYARGGDLYFDNETGSGNGLGTPTVSSRNNLASIGGSGTINGNINNKAGNTVSLQPGGASKVGTFTVHGIYYWNNINSLVTDVESDNSYDKLVVDSLYYINGYRYSMNFLNSYQPTGPISYQVFDCSKIGIQGQTVKADTVITANKVTLPTLTNTDLAWDYSDLQSKGIVRVVSATGIQNAYSTSVTIYKNGDDLLINLPEVVQSGSVNLYNVGGALVKQANMTSGTSSVTIPIGGLAQGVYIVKVISAKGLATKKVIF